MEPEKNNLKDAGITILPDSRLTQPVLNVWNGIVREVLKLKKDDPLPKDPYEGRYVRLAFNNKGLLAYPKARGRGSRIKPHRNLRALQQAQDSLALIRQFVGEEFGKLFFAEQKRLKEAGEGEEMKPITQEQMDHVQMIAFRKARLVMERRERDAQRAGRRRHRLSRRINFGLVAGNTAREVHSA